jgi:hypothetical protein
MPLRDGAYSTPYDDGDRKDEEGMNTATSSSVKAHRHHKAVRRLPLLRQANPGDDEPWLKKRTGLSLGYLCSTVRAASWPVLTPDLVVVTVLGTFSNTHSVRTPDSIPIFFSYVTAPLSQPCSTHSSFFIIVVCIWVSQIHYDVRYEAEDAFHRIFKALQIIVFMFIGASGGGWNPGRIVKIRDVAGDDSAAQRQLNHGMCVAPRLSLTLQTRRPCPSSPLPSRLQPPVRSSPSSTWSLSSPEDGSSGACQPQQRSSAWRCPVLLQSWPAALNASSRRRAHIKVILFYIGVGIDTITALWQYSDSGPFPPSRLRGAMVPSA